MNISSQFLHSADPTVRLECLVTPSLVLAAAAFLRYLAEEGLWILAGGGAEGGTWRLLTWRRLRLVDAAERLAGALALCD